MLFVGIDVAKEKHDCFMMDSDEVVHCNVLTFPSNKTGFEQLLATIKKAAGTEFPENVKVGLESTDHYSNNLIHFLKQSKLYVTVFNPLHINLFRKAMTLRKTKTDKCDARFIAEMLVTDRTKSYQEQSYHICELKSLTRNRFRLVGYRTRLKISFSRLLDIIFPELAAAVWSVNQSSVYALLKELPNSAAISACNVIKLSNILISGSKGKYRRAKADEIKALAKDSIGDNSPALAFELQQTLRLIQHVSEEITLADKQIKTIMLKLDSPVMSIPGISFTLGAVIVSEIGDISNFSNPSKLLAFAGCEPSQHQSGKYVANITPMVKRGSKYLRYALITAARLTAIKCPAFKAFQQRKLSEGKHHFVALSHTTRKLVRVLYHLLATNTPFNISI
jgi:transposase